MCGLREALRKFFVGSPSREEKPKLTTPRKPARSTVAAMPSQSKAVPKPAQAKVAPKPAQRKVAARPAQGKPVARSMRTTLPAAQRPSAPEHPKVEVLRPEPGRVPIPYWLVRRWRRVADNLFLGHFKTRLGRRHGVIKWNSEFDYGVYIHNVPEAILSGPHGACFTEVKPGKFRVHFAEQPKDVNGLIFYVEIMLMEAFEK